MKADSTRFVILLLLVSFTICVVSAARGDLVGHNGLVAAYKPYIVFPQNNHAYSPNSLALNVSFKAMAYANMEYSMTYSLDGKPREVLPVTKHYLGNWAIYHGENDYVDGSVNLPSLSEGPHTITAFLVLDWEIGGQNGVATYTYYDSEMVNFDIVQNVTPEQPAGQFQTLTPFGYDELSGQILVTAPVCNFTYSEPDIVANVSLHIGGHEYEPNTHYVPYENISCVYSLDGSEWRNMTLVSSAKSELFPSIPNNFWYSNMWLNYTATLQGVSEGLHCLKIGVKPDSIPTRDLMSSEDQPLVYFNVANQPSTLPAIDPLPKLVIAIVISGSLAAATAVVIYRKKRGASGVGAVKNP